jgi:integrase
LRAGDFLEAWFDEKKLELKASTEAGWTRTVRNLLLPQLANLLLIERTRESIVSWLRSLDVGRKRPMSNKRLASIQTVLRQALAIAVERKLVDVNPLASYTYSRKISVRVSTFDLEALAVKDRVDPFSTEEQTTLIYAAEPQMRNYIQFALWTGLRTSELVALNWGDVDWQAGTVRVWKAMTAEAKSKGQRKRQTRRLAGAK